MKWWLHAGNWLGFCPWRGWRWVPVKQAAPYKPRGGWLWDSSCGCVVRASSVCKSSRGMGLRFPFFNYREKEKKRNHFLSVKSCVSSFVNFSLPEKMLFIPKRLFSGLGIGIWKCYLQGKTHKATSYFVDSFGPVPFHIGHSLTTLCLWQLRTGPFPPSFPSCKRWSMGSGLSPQRNTKLLEKKKKTWLKMIIFPRWSNFPNSFSNWFTQTNNFLSP